MITGSIARIYGMELFHLDGYECRHKWWNARPEKITRKAIYSYDCAGCGKPFTAYGNSRRKYCCHACYIADRFQDGDGDE